MSKFGGFSLVVPAQQSVAKVSVVDQFMKKREKFEVVADLISQRFIGAGPNSEGPQCISGMVLIVGASLGNEIQPLLAKS